MYTKRNFSSMLRTLMCSALMCVAFVGFAQVNTYDVADQGYLRKPMEAKNGLVLTNNRYSEIYLLQDNQLKTLVKGRGAGIYTEMSKDKTLVGFKSINDDDLQAPAVVHVATGVVNILEDYVWECGQVSFADDGTMAYTMGDKLIVRKGGDRKSYDLGFYTNIVKLSPDAKHVAYGHIEGQYYIKNLETGAVEQVPVVDGYDGVWSPDGSKLAIQTATGRLAVLEQATKRVYDLGEGQSANWANNSEELVFTKLDRNDIQINGASVQKVRFDGSNAVTLIPSTEDMPTDALLTSDNQLVIPYAGELKRCVAVRPMPKATAPGAATLSGAAQEKVVYDIVDGEFGARLENINKAPLKNGGLKNIKGRKNAQAIEGTIGQLDIPYLNQIYDSPAVNGCTRHGYVTCAPTSACMFLGYYDLLPKKATTNRYDGTTKYYAHAISAVFTNKAGNTTFNITAYGNGCYNVPGGYGYMWYGSRAPSGGYMTSFMKLNGCATADYNSSWSTFRSQVKAGIPYPLCIALESSGHLILGFRTNCYYRTSEGGFVAREGCFVCHDPYGDCNDSKWADNDGQHSSYDWVGYNSGRANIGTFYWGVKATPPASSVTPVEKKITVNPTSVTLKAVYQSSEFNYVDVKVTATGLSKVLNVASVNSTVNLEKLSGWDDYKGGTLRISVNTNYKLGMGAYSGYVAIQSGSEANNDMVRVEILTDISITDANGDVPSKEEPEPLPGEGEEPSTPSTPSEPSVSYSKGVTKVWQNTAKVPGSAAYNGTGPRFAAVSNGKMIASDKENNKIVEITESGYSDYYDPSAAITANYSQTIGVAIATDDAGNILVNSGFGAAGSSSNFTIISADLSKTYKLDLSGISGYTTAGSRVDQIGRIRGNMLSAEGAYFTILPNTLTYAVVVKVVNGALASSELVETGLTNTTSFIAQPAYETVAEMSSNMKKSFILRSRGVPQSVYTWGSASTMDKGYTFTAAAEGGYTTAKAGVEGFDWFKLGGKSYFIMPMTAAGTDATRGSYFGIYDQDGNLVANWAEGQKTTGNAAFGSFVVVPNDAYSVHIYHFVPATIAEKLLFAPEDVSISTGVEEIATDVEAPVEYYNLQGVRVMNPENGLYIKRQGNKVTKVIL